MKMDNATAAGSAEYENDFPELARFVQNGGFGKEVKGHLAAVIPRILGQGTTRADGLEKAPAKIERMMELADLRVPASVQLPPAVLAEVASAQEAVRKLREELAKDDGLRRFASTCLEQVSATSGYKDGYWCADGLLLIGSKDRFEWSWCVTKHYAIVAKLPPDPSYVAEGYLAAREKLRQLTLPAAVFEQRLRLAWLVARQHSVSDDVPVVDVMRMYQVAGQSDKFWQNPRRHYYKDLPEAAFAVNVASWRASSDSGGGFEFVPATIHQTGPGRCFFMPLNREGTEVRPMIALRYRSR